MAYSFSDVVNALAVIHVIGEEKRSAFASRIQHMQKLGFPDGINTGRGRAAKYQAHHAFKIGVALQLSEIGLNPERAIATVNLSRDNLARGVQKALGIGGPPEPVLCQVPAGRLQDLVYGDNVSDYAGLAPIDRQQAEKMVDFLMEVDGPVNWVVFSLSGLVQRLGLLMRATGREGEPTFEEALGSWAEMVVRAHVRS